MESRPRHRDPGFTEAVAIRWLLDGDPAVRWQTLRDLAGAADREVERSRGRMAREGWAARLLAKQDPDGRWAGGESPDAGLYSPKWISTTYTMLLLRDMGLAPGSRQARRACAHLLDRGLQKDGGVSYGWRGKSETCVTGIVLSILSHFDYEDDRLDTLAGNLLEQQMSDGGWNCQRRFGATHSSMNTTISALEALQSYELLRRGKSRAVRAAQRRGREFLLAHRLFRSHTTGDVIKRDFVRLAFPPRWHYDVLRALDHFRVAGAPRDERLREAVEIVRAARGADGRWPLQHTYRGKTWFEMERVGAPSRWITLRALRVLKWWEAGI